VTRSVCLVPAILLLAACGGETPPAPERHPGPLGQGDPTLGASAPGLAEGRAVYEHWCAPCHAPVPSLAGTLALQTKYEGEIPAALVHRTDLDKDTIALFVRQGVAWMAPFRKTEITDEELDRLTDYLTAPLADRGVDVAALAAQEDGE